ncbi:DUF4352 domain-containing protein [Actinoplanes sp. TRM 88003]|uniref:DUF4352 domain-containing protein n=1 Tax=Paractinoplanes aksuensis TaxID=2939490 RepID=A0ABT1DMR8_9ACTN|nr:DUF4352 domain-containing protein [Actinoplanes aksuensis]MCO8271798.1 DUF4352 domain-containing protein [Actinoplanes aksuensis]
MTHTPKHRAWHWIAGGAAVFMLLACGGVSAGDDTTEAADEPAAAAPAAKKTEAKKKDSMPGLNQPAKDGDFQFTVTGVKCGVAKVGSAYLNEKAQGQFCLVSVQIKNIGKEAQTMVDSVQKAFDAKGTEYSVDSGAAIYANEDQQVFFEEINPGNTAKGKLVFDIPKGTKLTTLELHDSLFSGGVKVALK